MRSPAEVAEVLALHRDGLGARRIATRTGLPLGTVASWLAGRLPRAARELGSDSRARPACERCGHPRHDFAELPPEYVYVLGLYLGDGCISAHHRGVHRLRVGLDAKYPGIAASAAAAIRRIDDRKVLIRLRQDNCIEVSAYWKAWPCLFPQAGGGKKHERPIILTSWQAELCDRWPQQLIRGLIHSDGSRFMNSGRCGWRWPRYSFFNKSDDIRAIFCDACDRLGVHWTASGGETIYISRKADVALLDEFIGPKR